MKKILKISLLVMVCSLFLVGCGSKDLSSGEIEDYKYEETEEETNYVKLVVNKNKVVLVELYPDVAPITVDNFKKLVKNHFYDDMIFHRVIEDFMVQTGDPEGTGMGGSEEQIKGEFTSNGITNPLKHDKGIVSMARSDDKDSASSQFFICVEDNESLGYLDGNYAAFGKVIAGYEFIEDISEVETDIYDKPISKQSLDSIRFVKVSKN